MLILVAISVFTLDLTLSQVIDEPWEHFFHEPLPIDGLPDLTENYFQPVCYFGSPGKEKVYLGTLNGLFVLNIGSSKWEIVSSINGPVFDLLRVNENEMYVGAWNGIYQFQNGEFELLEETKGIPTVTLVLANNSFFFGGPQGIFSCDKEESKLRKIDVKIPRSIRKLVVDATGKIWVATDMGLVGIKGNEITHYTHKENIFDESFPTGLELISNALKSATFLPNGELWVGGLGGVTILREDKVVKKIPYKRFPSGEITSIVYDEGKDRVWVGTANGLVLLRGKEKKVFRSRRWLVSDHVKDVDLWKGKIVVSTSEGVSILSTEMRTLGEKAEYFEWVTQQRHTREPGIVEKCKLKVPGDISTWEPMDTDNDGGYTTMYLASLALEYAVTKDISVRNRAKQIFKGVLFLEEVTGSPGFIARTVIPSDWKTMADPNEDFTPEREIYVKAIDPRYKVVENRWRLSNDGKWLWKGDTSSDEITAHFFGLAIYYDYCADEEDKIKIEALVRRMMDRIISDGYVLKDIDGKHTRWGVWSPEKLKNDPDWANERGINAVEILSYLKTAYHITGDKKYQEKYEQLLINENYAELVKRAKNYGASARTHIDDELLAFAYPALFRYEKDEKWLSIFKESIEHWYKGASKEKSPFFNFIYAWCMGKDPNLKESIHTLRDIPYDLVDWTVDNSTREDIRLVREPILEKIQTSRLLPPMERGVIRWDKNCWEAVQGSGGRTEWAPTFYLFPYWLGRHLGLITNP
ncbi:MAG: hypothetical protein N3G21_09720 [Candidatus Hydrogenedentes bacterium]|nr:hypothetical protein [Candidatus Hydrogenedentota bacterium]